MTSQNNRSKNRNNLQHNTSRLPSLDEILSTTDTGDDTQRRFRYQHAYGIVLLAAAIARKKPYIAIWCEHHEDLLAQREDGNFDAYQIKTRQSGSWTLSDDALKSSIKSFVELDQQSPGKINEYYFVSNTNYENSNIESKLGRSPVKFLKAVEQVTSPDVLLPPFNTSFEVLRQYCECEPLELIAVLKRLKLVKGPGLESFEDEIAQSHLAPLTVCKHIPAAALANLRDDLIAQIYKASSLSSSDPARHWYGLNEADSRNPYLQAKKITTESLLSFLRANTSPIASKDAHMLSESLQEALDLYLAALFKEDQVAKLDQAGETDSDRTTLLHQVFVDLELKPRKEQPKPPDHFRPKQERLPFPAGFEQIPAETSAHRREVLSAMDCFLKEISARFVIIGGPGQGKSTLGQYLAQIHRAILLKKEKELYQNIIGSTVSQKHFRPKTERIPFRLVLKYFAQWLTDSPRHETVEAYIAEQICKKARRREVNETAIHKILKARPTLLIFDGLDEVTEQKLCNRMLSCIENFLARAEQLGADMQVIATSRPTSYKDQFTPNDFWHLELQPMSVKKVNEYAANWINIKVLIEEEQQRVKRTLNECLQEAHTRDLLTTPLQVTIILLIIKDRGRPPSQREALFQKYWSTILDREKAKAQDIIHTDDHLLFSLHAYMGYILHKNAATENARALLPTNEFEQLAYNFLRSDDSRSPAEVIQRRVSQMIKEARTRLVLIVEPENGFLGFEIRSLQEFFAGVYLVETAHDTEQRFARLKTIAYLQHWHNVALFVSGRVVNHHRGEAANILEMVCRPIDREYPDTYLRRGAWLALDMAADGVFGSYRNLQSSALEHALTMLPKGITQEDQKHIKDALQRLSLDDRRDILSELLKEKLTSVPLSWLPTVIDIYGQFIETDQNFMQAVDILLSSNQQWLVIEALNLGYSYRVNPVWLATQLERHWHTWIREDEKFLSVQEWWKEDPQYTEKVLLALSLSVDFAEDLMDCLLIRDEYYYREEIQYQLMGSPGSPSEQIILLLQCLYIQEAYRKLNLGGIVEFDLGNSWRSSLNNAERSYKEEESFTKLMPLETIDQLIKRSDLMPQLKACLWSLYWDICKSIENSQIEKFFNECRNWKKSHIVANYLKLNLKRSRPLLGLALEYQMRNDLNKVALLQPYISQEPSIAQRTGKVLHKKFSKLPTEEQFVIGLSGNCPANTFPELVPIAEELGLSLGQLVDMYSDVTSVLYGIMLAPAVLQKMFTQIEKSLAQFQGSWSTQWIWELCSWKLDHETAQQGVQLLSTLKEKFPHHTDILITIFLKLLQFDDTPLRLAPAILNCLANETIQRDYPASYQLNDDWLSIPPKRLADLAKFTKHEDTKVQQGAITLWVRLIESVLTRPYPSEEVRTANLTVLDSDWQLGLSLVKNVDTATKRQGIVLLICAPLPILGTKYFDELSSTLSEAQHPEEITAWVLFLKNFLIRASSERAIWQKLLETLLANPQRYAFRILAAAMERYRNLISKDDLKIRNENALNLS